MNDYKETIRSFKLRNFYSEVHGLIYRQPENAERILRFGFQHCVERGWRFEASYLLHRLVTSGFSVEPEIRLLAEGKEATHLLDECEPPASGGFETLAEEHFALAKYFRWYILAGRVGDAAEVISELVQRKVVIFPLVEELMEIKTGEKYARLYKELPKAYLCTHR